MYVYDLIQQVEYHPHQSSFDILHSEQFDSDGLMFVRMVVVQFHIAVHKYLTLEYLLQCMLLFDSQYMVHHQSLTYPPYRVLEMYIP